MRPLKFLALAALLAVAASSLLHPAQGQTPTAADLKAAADNKAIAEAVQVLQNQQKTIADNQGKIDDKLADIAECIRVARIYAARVR